MDFVSCPYCDKTLASEEAYDHCMQNHYIKEFNAFGKSKEQLQKDWEQANKESYDMVAES